MRYLKFLALCGLLYIWGAPLQAATVAGLYEAEAEVADQGREARGTAMSEALAAVLLKVTGTREGVADEAIQAELKNASRYVRQYRYRTDSSNRAQNRLLLWVSFDSASVDAMLQRLGFSVWSAVRPQTLVWLAVDDGSRRSLIGANDQGAVRELLDGEAAARGIPLHLPLLDLTDQSKVQVVDVWGNFLDKVEAGSKRYEAEALLIGKLYREGRGWGGRWTLRYQGERYEWQGRGNEVGEVIAAGVGGTADHLVQRFAATSYQGREELLLRVEGVSGMGQFRRASDYLNSLHGVQAVVLRRTDAASCTFLLEIEGGREGVLREIGLGDTLLKVEHPLPPATPWRSSPVGAARAIAPVEAVPRPLPPGAATVPASEGLPSEGGDDRPLSQPLQPPEVVYRLLS